ncbi:LAMI_0G11628g1_1 [Lachancea mirantina]|uniref:Large ribosomal subunit protein mL49 n=1 Tax=Lachancea mirantina TaxID=1230905 RepID=A0A1G4KB42_9SACH|nr:LAMI_0G11628g1_1 [Lachancea mirantina]
MLRQVRSNVPLKVLNGNRLGCHQLRFQSSLMVMKPGEVNSVRQEEASLAGKLNDKNTTSKLGLVEPVEIEEQMFSVFPGIEDVHPDQLVGSGNFGIKNYFVERSATGNLPVYSDFKRNGKVFTEIRKVYGDPVQLRNDLQENLKNIPQKAIKVIMQSRKVVIEGNAVKEVKQLLSQTF